MQCPNCAAIMTFGADPMVVSVGPHQVESRSFPHYNCPTCQAVLLEPTARSLLEVQAAILVHSEVAVTDPAAVRFARALLKLSESELAALLGATEERIGAIERGTLPVTAEYRLALAGLLGVLERKLRGLPHGGPKLVGG